jgi:imidazolonepropionase-like amidohydrolase
MIIFENVSLLDGSQDHAASGMSVLVEGETIREVSDKSIPGNAQRIDLKGKTLMPGLIDCHIHVVAALANLGANAMLPDAVVALDSAKRMRETLLRGFTTVRDLGGATLGLRMACEQGLFQGPRMTLCGKALSQTGGHCDFRGRFDTRPADFFAARLGSMGRLVDGVADVRRACREEIKAGADYIKIMANGGVASPSDPIAFLGFSEEEIAAAVEEARMAQTYVAAHLYTAEAISRAVRLGVRSLEHCNLIDAKTARQAAAAGAIACPTLVTYEALHNEAASLGMSAESVGKIDDVRLKGMESIAIMAEAGLMMAYGTDLLGPMQRHQSEEFVIRGRVQPAIEVIRSATVNAAILMNQVGRIGCVAPGALADIIVVDGDPLADLSLLTHQGAHMPAIMQGGRFVKNTLN